MARPRGIDMDLVRTQQVRRAPDYLVGFNLSALLWRKVKCMGARERRCSGADFPRVEVTAARHFGIVEGAGRGVLRECR